MRKQTGSDQHPVDDWTAAESSEQSTAPGTGASALRTIHLGQAKARDF